MDAGPRSGQTILQTRMSKLQDVSPSMDTAAANAATAIQLQLQEAAVAKVRTQLIDTGAVPLVAQPEDDEFDVKPQSVLDTRQSSSGIGAFISKWQSSCGPMLEEGLLSSLPQDMDGTIGEVLFGDLSLSKPLGAMSTHPNFKKKNGKYKKPASVEDTPDDGTAAAPLAREEIRITELSHHILLEAIHVPKRSKRNQNTEAFDHKIAEELLRLERCLGILRTRQAILDCIESPSFPFTLNNSTEAESSSDSWVYNEDAADVEPGTQCPTHVDEVVVHKWVMKNVEQMARPITDLVAMMVLIVPESGAELTVARLREQLKDTSAPFVHLRALHDAYRVSLYPARKERTESPGSSAAGTESSTRPDPTDINALNQEVASLQAALREANKAKQDAETLVKQANKSAAAAEARAAAAAAALKKHQTDAKQAFQDAFAMLQAKLAP